jgi:hypothetical protein
VAKRIGVSTTTISLVLAGKYRASVTNIEQRVRGVLLSQKVACPVLEQIDRKRCVELQQPPASQNNRLRITIYERCQTCPNAQTKAGRR